MLNNIVVKCFCQMLQTVELLSSPGVSTESDHRQESKNSLLLTRSASSEIVFYMT